MSTNSIALRIRRVTYEDAYVAVPVTTAIVRKADDGSAQLDADALFAEANRISQDPRVEWQIESTNAEIHPTQQAPPNERRPLDPFDDISNS